MSAYAEILPSVVKMVNDCQKGTKVGRINETVIRNAFSLCDSISAEDLGQVTRLELRGATYLTHHDYNLRRLSELRRSNYSAPFTELIIDELVPDVFRRRPKYLHARAVLFYLRTTILCRSRSLGALLQHLSGVAFLSSLDIEYHERYGMTRFLIECDISGTRSDMYFNESVG